MPETTTTLDPSLCCCGTTTTPAPLSCKCAVPVTLDFHTNVIVPVTLEINMPRGNSGFPGQNLFLKTYIHGCHSINHAYCLPNNTLATPSCPDPPWPKDGVFHNLHSPYFYIEEPANCNPILPPAAITGWTDSWDYVEWCFARYPNPHVASISSCLQHIKDIYGYLPAFLYLHWWSLAPAFPELDALGFPKKYWRDFSSNFSNGVFFCCNQGILQDLSNRWNFTTGEILNVVVNSAFFAPYVILAFPIFNDKIFKAWVREELDNLILYGPVVLLVAIRWYFDVSALISGSNGNTIRNTSYFGTTHNFFVKVLQFPFSGGSLNFDLHDSCFSFSPDVNWVDSSGNIIPIDYKTKFSIIFPDILNVVENMQATIHFGEITPNLTHSEDGAIDWSYVGHGRHFSGFVECRSDGEDYFWDFPSLLAWLNGGATIAY